MKERFAPFRSTKDSKFQLAWEVSLILPPPPRAFHCIAAVKLRFALQLDCGGECAVKRGGGELAVGY